MGRKGLVVIVVLAVSPLVWAAGSEAKEEVMYYCPICDSGIFSEEEWRHYLEVNHPEVDLTGKSPMKIKRSELGKMKKEHHKGSGHKEEKKGSETK